MNNAALYPVSYLNWVLLWINAIKDAYLFIDSPDCFFYKVQHIAWNHDLNSTLFDSSWHHRFIQTVSTTSSVIWNNNTFFENKLLEIAKSSLSKVIFITSMPMNQLLWVDFDFIINNVKNNSWKKDIFHIPPKSTTDCWLDWYSDLLFSLSKNIDISWAKPQKNKVAIVWNMFDRNEWDCRWNVKELKNIFEWLWLEVVSIWLEWWNYADILKVKEAWTIISLPYGRKAAKKIAKRLDIWLLELDVPFWINNTIEFIEEVWKYFKVDNKKIKRFIYEELFIRNDIWMLKWKEENF